jgi:photosystem II stability/assembly factor-like uncharacterized protein
MKFRNLLLLTASFCCVILWSVTQKTIKKQLPAEKQEQEKYSGPEQFALFHKAIRTPEGASGPQYQPGYKIKEFENAKVNAQARKRSGARTQSNGVIEWTERGPVNVPGRTRGLIVDPDDATKNTWYAGSVGGGVWKTMDGGTNWTLLTPDLPNLATTVLAMAPSNHDVIYLGTGEGFGNLDGISGNGMFKSLDRGQTWNYLPATSNFNDINRAIVDPASEDVVVVATNTGIYRTVNGGTSWTQVSTLEGIQDLKANPADFSIQYAAQNGVGVLKSINGGQSWSLSNLGMDPDGRVEIAVSTVNTNRIFASTEGTLSGSTSDLYVSNNAGVTWSLINVTFNSQVFDFLGGQGWYDNTIACDPFNADIVYFGGVNLFRVTLTTGSQLVPNYKLEEINTSEFLFLQSFTNIQYDNARLTVGSEAGEKNVEIRFGPGIKQKAHLFLVPEGATSGVLVNNYSFTDYVDVPFQVWDVTNELNPRQIMVSFRDQNRNGQFDLVPQFLEAAPPADPLLHSREYVYINNVDYSETQNASIAVAGGQEHKLMYNFFPALASGETWDPDNLPVSSLEINYTGISKLNASMTTMSDAYGQFDSKNRFINYGTDIHPDQHNLVVIPMTGSTFKILNASDGGIFISNTSATPGIAQGNWTMVGRTFNTSQFYGADKKPGADVYFGGMQDNGTWRSNPNISATKTTSYLFAIGGDGFEVIWHNLDDQKLIGGSQGNNFRRSTDGGASWTSATSGLSGSHPFISKLANSKANPDLIYTLSSAGVFRSTNFGASWVLTPITNKWGSTTSLMDVEVSRANANIIWAGSGMTPDRNLHVSLDAGVTFNPTENSSLISGGITKLASHPTEENTAYALFSQAGNPKILRTEDLGQTWEDLSGFGVGNVSTNGFPDVAVYSLYVRPDNPDIIWAGTEIGIVESQDNGQNWALLDDFPNVSVWDMKGQDDQVVIATHGRGIWTATIEAPQVSVITPDIIASGTSPKEKLLLKVNVSESFDRIELYEGTTLLGTLDDVTPAELVITVSGLSPGTKNIKLISYKGTAPFHSKTYTIELLDILSVENEYSTYFNNLNDLTVKGFALQSFPGASSGDRKTLQTNHDYSTNTNYNFIIRHPVKLSATFPKLQYEDIAIVEPGLDGAAFGTTDFKDYVVVEASKNGLDWTPLEDGYDARANTNWLTAFNSASAGTKSMFVHHEIDLSTKFSVGDTLLFRYRLFSNASTTAWGWALNYVTIQQAPTATENPLLRGENLALFPNPTSGNFTVEFSLTRATEVRAEVMDLFGRVVASNVSQKEIGTHQETFNLSNQPQGSYLVVLRTNSGNMVGKISIKR